MHSDSVDNRSLQSDTHLISLCVMELPEGKNQNFQKASDTATGRIVFRKTTAIVMFLTLIALGGAIAEYYARKPKPLHEAPRSVSETTDVSHETDQCSPEVQEYKNSRYGYKVIMPSGWRLATHVASKSNPGIPIESADPVYFTNLFCHVEVQTSDEISRSRIPWAETSSVKCSAAAVL